MHLRRCTETTVVSACEQVGNRKAQSMLRQQLQVKFRSSRERFEARATQTFALLRGPASRARHLQATAMRSHIHMQHVTSVTTSGATHTHK